MCRQMGWPICRIKRQYATVIKCITYRMRSAPYQPPNAPVSSRLGRPKRKNNQTKKVHPCLVAGLPFYLSKTTEMMRDFYGAAPHFGWRLTELIAAFLYSKNHKQNFRHFFFDSPIPFLVDATAVLYIFWTATRHLIVPKTSFFDKTINTLFCCQPFDLIPITPACYSWVLLIKISIQWNCDERD